MQSIKNHWQDKNLHHSKLLANSSFLIQISLFNGELQFIEIFHSFLKIITFNISFI